MSKQIEVKTTRAVREAKQKSIRVKTWNPGKQVQKRDKTPEQYWDNGMGGVYWSYNKYIPKLSE